MDESPLLQRGADRAVQAVLEVQRPAPSHDVREQVPVERRVVREQGIEVERALGGHELGQP